MGPRRKAQGPLPQGRYGILTPHHKKWQSVYDQFKKSWRHPVTPKKPKFSKVIRILGVTPPRYLVARYERYRHALEKRGHFSRRGMRKGNERRRWHGTKANCKFFRTNLPSKGRCNDRSCAICGIINVGFRLPKPSKKFERFGYGIYLSSTSSKSDDYNGPKNAVRALLLCRLAVGRGKKMYANSTHLTRAPKGYDSVLGERSAVLNYDEVVVYNPAAILPAYVVVYR